MTQKFVTEMYSEGKTNDCWFSEVNKLMKEHQDDIKGHGTLK